MGLIPERPRLTIPAEQETAPMPVTNPHHLLDDYLGKLPVIRAGLYVERGINGAIMLSVYDESGDLIREDHIALQHFDAETLAAAEEWMETHRRAG